MAGQFQPFVSHIFWTRSQIYCETVDDWPIDLSRTATPRNFKEKNRMLTDRILSGVIWDLTLGDAIDIRLAMKNSREQLKSFKKEENATPML